MLLVTGSNGQLGSELKSMLPRAIFTDVTELDITDSEAVNTFVKNNNIDSIINCAAYTAVDRAEEELEMAQKINVIGASNLAKTGAKIIHISTDYVFDGTNHRPYTEIEQTNPLSVYGRTKLLGEQKVLQYAECAMVVRTAWLYSAHGNNFVKTMRRLGASQEKITVVADQVGTPTYAGDLAQAILKILPQLTVDKRGIYHFTNEGICSWYDFAQEIMELSALPCRVLPIATEDYPTQATRPAYSVLNKAKIKKTFNLQIPYWKDGLKRCLKRF